MMQRVRGEKIAFPWAKRTESANAPNPHLLNVSSPSKRGKNNGVVVLALNDVLGA